MRWPVRLLDCELKRSFTLSLHILGAFDESGKFHDAKVISFCGFLGTSREWHALQLEWDVLLRRHGIASLHMSGNALNFRRKLSAKNPALGLEARIKVISEFIRVIQKNIEMGIAIAIDVEAFKNLPEHCRVAMGDPHYIAFSAAMADVFGFTRANDAKACIICDDEEKYFVECYKLLARYKREDPSVRHRFIAMSAANDKEFDELQAADLLAYVTRCEAGKRFLGTSYQFEELHAEFERSEPDYKLRFSPGSGFWGKERLLQHCDLIRKRPKKP